MKTSFHSPSFSPTAEQVSDSKAVKQLVALLTAPLDAYDVVSVLSLGAYPKARERPKFAAQSPPPDRASARRPPDPILPIESKIPDRTVSEVICS